MHTEGTVIANRSQIKFHYNPMNGRPIDEHCTTAKGGPVGQTDAAAIKEKEKPIHDSADETLIHLTKGLLRMRKEKQWNSN